MTNNIKNEFEEYVKTLTEAICKEIFLERLEELCGEYEEGYKKIAGTANEIGLISKKIDEGSLKISDKLDGVITPEQLTEFRKYLEENTKESKELANFINETYKSEIEENIRHIIAKNQQLQRDLNNSIAEHVKGILDKLDNAADVVNDKLLENARNFSEYTGNQKKNIERFISENERQNAAYNKQLQDTINSFMREQKELEKRKFQNNERIEKSIDNLSWKMYMMFSNTVIMLLFVLLIIFQKPWEIFGYKTSIIVASSLFTVFLFMIFLRRGIAKIIVKHREKKQVNKLK